ncbi:hypothetical protein [Nocardiopsis sp. JB363]|nr:hypothetical protein [Nocardiopsis sp. JB363]
MEQGPLQLTDVVIIEVSVEGLEFRHTVDEAVYITGQLTGDGLAR